jgi:ubiquinone/menaquinone biosynthesis C-methylase UbiE
VRVTPAESNQQALVDSYFDAEAGYWREVYARGGVEGMVYRRRMETAARWTQELELPAGTAALEVGCGAGLLTVELARAGLSVIATDSSPEMVELATRQVAGAGLAERAEVREADVHRLPFRDGEFGLVVALGLLPWLHDPNGAVAELARVLAPGGWMILTADNRARLNSLIEPRDHPLLTPLKLARRALTRRTSEQQSSAPSYLHRPAQVDAMLATAGVSAVRRTTIGFGPFTFLGRPLLSERLGAALHLRLQAAGRDSPGLRRTGWHYLVAARKADGSSQLR